MARKGAGRQRRPARGRTRGGGNGRPGRGRPRSARVQKAILDATLELLAETGMSALTVEGVAARAKVGKATIYRRWASKLPLVVEAITTLPELPVPSTGTIEGDLREIIGNLAVIFQSSPRGRVLAQLAAERGSDPEVDTAVRRFVRVRRQPVVDVMRTGLARGELPAGLDPEVLTDLVVGPIVNRLLFLRRRVDGRFVDEVVGTVLAGAMRAASAPAARPHAAR